MTEINIKQYIEQHTESINDIYPLITLLIKKTRTDNELNKFISLCLKLNILIFENDGNKWKIKTKTTLNENVNSLYNEIYNDFILNIKQIQIQKNFKRDKHLLDKNINILKKKLKELNNLIQYFDDNIDDILKKISDIHIEYVMDNLIIDDNNYKTIIFENNNKIKIKKMFNNDIFIEEFSN
jgi:hypothetical protein